MKIATIRWFESQESYTWISVAVARTSGDDGTTPGKLHTACMGMGQKSVVSNPGIVDFPAVSLGRAILSCIPVWD